MRRSTALALLLTLVLHACASYTPSSAPIPRSGAMPAWQGGDAVTVGVDPYVQVDRQKATFDADLREQGVLPLQVLIQNTGARPVLVRKAEILLVLPGGRELAPVGASSVSSRMESIGGVVGWGLAFGIIGVLAASSAEDKARTARLEDYRQKEFKDATLAAGGEAHGFVYFIPPKGTPAFEEATLALRAIDAESLTATVVRVQMARLGFLGRTPD